MTKSVLTFCFGRWERSVGWPEAYAQADLGSQLARPLEAVLGQTGRQPIRGGLHFGRVERGRLCRGTQTHPGQATRLSNVVHSTLEIRPRSGQRDETHFVSPITYFHQLGLKSWHWLFLTFFLNGQRSPTWSWRNLKFFDRFHWFLSSCKKNP